MKLNINSIPFHQNSEASFHILYWFIKSAALHRSICKTSRDYCVLTCSRAQISIGSSLWFWWSKKQQKRRCGRVIALTTVLICAATPTAHRNARLETIENATDPIKVGWTKEKLRQTISKIFKAQNSKQWQGWNTNTRYWRVETEGLLGISRQSERGHNTTIRPHGQTFFGGPSNLQ